MAAPTNINVTADASGLILTFLYDQPVFNVNPANYSVGGGSYTLSNAVSVGDGSSWTMSISPGINFGDNLVILYFSGTTVNGSAQSLVGFTHSIINGSGVGKPSADSGAIFLMM